MDDLERQAQMPGSASGAPTRPDRDPAGEGPYAELGQHVRRLEEMLDRPGAMPPAQAARQPAWRRPTPGEKRWPVTVATAAAIGLQVALPDRFSLSSRYLLPTIEIVMLIALVAMNPRRVERISAPLRTFGLTLIATASVANAWSATLLIIHLVTGAEGGAAGPLLTTGVDIYLTNIIIFALWYWELDRGGPAARAAATHANPDFLFPQMATPDIADSDWEPGFADYFYVSFTNATAFSPTDTMPLTRWTKMIMTLQSAVSLVTVALVIARAVNILK